jgi:Protein of unknown function (DUF1580)
VSANILNENLLSLKNAADLLPDGRNGRPVHFSCVLRWVQTGAKAPNGERVRLEAVRVGCRWLTSVEALGRFAARLTPEFSATLPPVRTAKKRAAAAARAVKQLGDEGI